MPDIPLDQQILEEIERRRIEPLQVVEEQCQRMIRLREYADELAQHQLEPASCILRREIRNRRLVSDDQRQLRDELDNQPPVKTERLEQRIAPRRQVRFAFAQQTSNEARKCLGERGVWNV